jgi:outer membrane protein OmpA-like peptidoglycan-associated protein
MMQRFRRSSLLGTLCAGLVLGLAGCASTPKNVPALEQARQDVEMARADAEAQRYAAKEVEDAGRLLSQAEDALDKRKDEPEVTHLAYLSSQTSKLAIERGKTKNAEERIASASKERDQIRLEARTREAEQARMEAKQAQSVAAATGAELASEQQRRQQLETQMEELMAKPSDRGLVITLGDVLFDTGRAELKSGADRQLDTVANFLEQNPERQVLIEGFTDSVGTEDYNRGLSERRAEAVRSALLSRGVDAGRIQVRGYGEEFPVGTNADAGGRQLNRRVEVIVSNGDQPVEPRARL